MGLGASRRRLREAGCAFTSNWRNHNLRRAQLSFLGAWTAEWAFTVALGIVAYDDGGALALGLVGLLRMLPSALLAPLLSPFADRGRRERVLVVVSTLRGVATAVAAVVVALAGPILLVYTLAVLSTIAATLFRPAHSALLPTLCRTGHELASANVVRGMLDSIATLVGPLLAAVLLAFTDVSVVFAVAAAASFWAALLLLRVRYDAPPRPAAPRRPDLGREALEGIRAAVQNRDLLLILGLAAAQSLTRGALTVFSVVVAIELLGTGDPGVGALMAAVGAGAVLGSLGASLLVGTGRLAAWFAIGVALWGLPIALVGVFPQEIAALGLLAFVGVGNALIDVAGFTLIARLAPDAVLARVFGVLESLVAVSIGLGAILAPAVIGWLGVEAALIGIGLVCPVLAVASWWRLRRLDRSVDNLDVDIGLLQRVPMLAPLPLPAIEQLARGLETVTVPAGQAVLTQGEVGDRYYVIESGEAEVVGDGRVVATLGPGDGFGEIALLRRTRRTASVVAATALELRALAADRFVSVVLGYTPSARAAEVGVQDRLDRFAPKESFDEPPTTS
ncbi:MULTISPECIES: MFS transporter [unclassified Microbacterium]|uniref:MFS transporter n=1 Tax=unclassified Microbacterium TaxID=2609290 RepID=UPI00214B5202|nr:MULTISPECIES: MFS transporter [unclassified Microbacterium]MCR2809673.1 MFS transporter [Microbacterium sp. zg.B185]WIM18005.1 MFS transporter [Microbacterium sp. zg-B185]